jgi:hypothetical protein
VGFKNGTDGNVRVAAETVLMAEEYRQNPQATHDRIANFLGVTPATIPHKDASTSTVTTTSVFSNGLAARFPRGPPPH